MKEVFKYIKGFEGIYQISNHGRVKSCERYYDYERRSKYGELFTQKYHRREAFLKPCLSMHGYYLVTLRTDNVINNSVAVHRLVAYTFLDNPPSDGQRWQVNHLDGNKTNNRLDNLEIITDAQNMAHARRTGLLKGRVNSMVLDFEDAEEIRRLYATGNYGQWRLANAYGVTQAHICNIVNYRTWKTDCRSLMVDKDSPEYQERLNKRKKK